MTATKTLAPYPRLRRAGLAAAVLAMAAAHSPVDLRPGPLLWPLVFAAGSGLVIAVLGMLAASKRAARVRPTEALREADLDSRTMTAGRAVTGVLALLGGAVMVALAPGSGTEAATPLALFGTMALAVAATLLGPLYLPPLLRVMALPLRWADPVAGRLAAESVRTSRRRTASLVGPVLAILAIVGVFTTVLSTTGAATSADDRARTTAQLVVEPAGDGGSLDQEAVDRLREDPRVAAVSAPAPLEIAVAGPHSAWKEQAALADPVAQQYAAHLLGFLSQFRDVDPAPELARLGAQCVALAGGEYDELSGRYLDLEKTLDQLVSEGQSGKQQAAVS